MVFSICLTLQVDPLVFLAQLLLQSEFVQDCEVLVDNLKWIASEEGSLKKFIAYADGHTETGPVLESTEYDSDTESSTEGHNTTVTTNTTITNNYRTTISCSHDDVVGAVGEVKTAVEGVNSTLVDKVEASLNAIEGQLLLQTPDIEEIRKNVALLQSALGTGSEFQENIDSITSVLGTAPTDSEGNVTGTIYSNLDKVRKILNEDMIAGSDSNKGIVKDTLAQHIASIRALLFMENAEDKQSFVEVLIQENVKDQDLADVITQLCSTSTTEEGMNMADLLFLMERAINGMGNDGNNNQLVPKTDLYDEGYYNMHTNLFALRATTNEVNRRIGEVGKEMYDISYDVVKAIQQSNHNYRVAHLYSLNNMASNVLWRPTTSEVPYIEDYVYVSGKFANVYTGYWDSYVTDVGKPAGVDKRALEILGDDILVRYEGVVIQDLSPLLGYPEDYQHNTIVTPTPTNPPKKDELGTEKYDIPASPTPTLSPTPTPTPTPTPKDMTPTPTPTLTPTPGLLYEQDMKHRVYSYNDNIIASYEQVLIPEDEITYLDAVTVLYKALDQYEYTYNSFMTEDASIRAENSPTAQNLSNIHNLNGFNFYVFMSRSNIIVDSYKEVLSKETVIDGSKLSLPYWYKAVSDGFVYQSQMTEKITGSEFFKLASKMMQTYGEPVYNQSEVDSLLQVYGKDYPIQLGTEIADAWAYLMVRGCLNVDIGFIDYLTREQLLDVAMCIKDKDSRTDYKNIDIVLDLADVLVSDGYYPVKDLEYTMDDFSIDCSLNFTDLTYYDYYFYLDDNVEQSIGTQVGFYTTSGNRVSNILIKASNDVNAEPLVGADYIGVETINGYNFYHFRLRKDAISDTALVNGIYLLPNQKDSTGAQVPTNISYIHIDQKYLTGGVYTSYTMDKSSNIKVLKVDCSLNTIQYFDSINNNKVLLANDALRSGTLSEEELRAIFDQSPAENLTVIEKLKYAWNSMTTPIRAYAWIGNNLRVNLDQTNEPCLLDHDGNVWKPTNLTVKGKNKSNTKPTVSTAGKPSSIGQTVNTVINQSVIDIANIYEYPVFAEKAKSANGGIATDIVFDSGADLCIPTITTAINNNKMAIIRNLNKDAFFPAQVLFGYYKFDSTGTPNAQKLVPSSSVNCTVIGDKSGNGQSYEAREWFFKFTQGLMPIGYKVPSDGKSFVNKNGDIVSFPRIKLVIPQNTAIQKIYIGADANPYVYSYSRAAEMIDAFNKYFTLVGCGTYSFKVLSDDTIDIGSLNHLKTLAALGIKQRTTVASAEGGNSETTVGSAIELDDTNMSSSVVMNREESILLKWDDLIDSGYVKDTFGGQEPYPKSDGVYYIETAYGTVKIHPENYTILIGTTLYSLRNSQGTGPVLIYYDSAQGDTYLDYRCIMGVATREIVRDENARTISWAENSIGVGSSVVYTFAGKEKNSAMFNSIDVASLNFPETNADLTLPHCKAQLITRTAYDGDKVQVQVGDSTGEFTYNPSGYRIVLNSFHPTANWLVVIDDKGSTYSSKLYVWYPRAAFTSKVATSGGDISPLINSTITLKDSDLPTANDVGQFVQYKGNYYKIPDFSSDTVLNAEAYASGEYFTISDALMGICGIDVNNWDNLQWVDKMTAVAAAQLWNDTNGNYFLSPEYVMRCFDLSTNIPSDCKTEFLKYSSVVLGAEETADSVGAVEYYQHYSEPDAAPNKLVLKQNKEQQNGNGMGTAYWLNNIGFVYNIPDFNKFDLVEYLLGYIPLPLAAVDESSSYTTTKAIVNFNMDYYGEAVTTDELIGNIVLPYGTTLCKDGYVVWYNYVQPYYITGDNNKVITLTRDILPLRAKTGGTTNIPYVPYGTEGSLFQYAPVGIYAMFGGAQHEYINAQNLTGVFTFQNHAFLGQRKITFDRAEEGKLFFWREGKGIFNSISIPTGTKFYRVQYTGDQWTVVAFTSNVSIGESNRVSEVDISDYITDDIDGWSNWVRLEHILQAIDQSTSFIILFLFKVVPIIGVIYMTVLIGLGFLMDWKPMKDFALTFTDPVYYLTFGVRNAQNFSARSSFVPCLIVYTMFACTLNGNIIRIIMFCMEGINSIVEYLRVF